MPIPPTGVDGILYGVTPPPAYSPKANLRFEAGGGVREVYALLLAAFGAQGWWPVTPSGKYLPVYTPGSYGPPSESGMFEICAGALLTQNTSWKNVEKALTALNRARLLSPEKIKACTAGRLARLIRPSGYYRRKAARLKGFCAYILREHPEGLKKWFSAAQRRTLRAELLSLKGIGPETADSIALYAAGKTNFVIDAYTRRIGRRSGFGRFVAEGTPQLRCPHGDLSYGDWQAFFQANLPLNVKIYNEYHALLVKLGKDFCKKKEPLCNGCPLRRLCKRNVTAQVDRL